MKTKLPLLVLVICHAIFSGVDGQQTLLVDFGANAGSNIYNTVQFPGWNNVTISPTLTYTNSGGHTGITLSSTPADSSNFSNYTCITGNAYTFNYGDRIYITWYNNTGMDITFNPLISFSDNDYPVDAPGEPQWFISNKYSDFYFLPGDTIRTIYDFTNNITCGPMVSASEGSWSVINICANTIVPGIILDKIYIGPADTTAPPSVQNLHVVSSDSKSITLAWDAVTDNSGGDGLLRYKIYENGLPFGFSDSSSFTAFALESGKQYSFSVTAIDLCRNESSSLAVVQASTSMYIEQTGLINPYLNLEYLGAFRLPDGGVNSDFSYMESDLAFYPLGDPGNSDAYSGSLFCAGNAVDRYVAEISIPVPVISATHNVNDLNVAVFLQDFTDIKSPNVPVIPFSWSKGPALEYMPTQAGQTQPYLYTCFGDYFQWNGERLKSFGASSLDFTNPNPIGGWYLGSETLYSEPNYMTTILFNFDMPAAINNHLLVAGGSRPGDVHHGPTLVAYSPWNDGTPLPGDDVHLSFTPLLMYDNDAGTNYLEGHSYGDLWSGGSWLSTESKQAVVIAGNKGRGDSWYGYDNGEPAFNVMFNVPTPVEPEDKGPRQSWFDALFLFYRPSDLQAVAVGNMLPYEPQPYAVLDLEPYLFYPNDETPYYGRKYHGPGGMTFDRQNGLIYMLEQNVTGIDTSVAIVHVWHVNSLVGINEHEQNNNYHISSFSGKITAESENSAEFTVDIFDITGKLFYSGNFSGAGEHSIPLNISNALCIVRITDKDNVITKKVFVK